MNLVTLSGKSKTMGEAPKFSLFSLSGMDLMKVDPRKLSDIAAGVYMLKMVDTAFPNVTYEQIVKASENKEKMSGLFGSVGKFIAGGIKDIHKATKKYTPAGWVFSLAKSKSPQQTIQNAQAGNVSPEERAALIAIGQQSKNEYNKQVLGMNPMFLIGGGLGIGGLILFLALRGGRKR